MKKFIILIFLTISFSSYSQSCEQALVSKTIKVYGKKNKKFIRKAKKEFRIYLKAKNEKLTENYSFITISEINYKRLSKKKYANFDTARYFCYINAKDMVPWFLLVAKNDTLIGSINYKYRFSPTNKSEENLTENKFFYLLKNEGVDMIFSVQNNFYDYFIKNRQLFVMIRIIEHYKLIGFEIMKAEDFLNSKELKEFLKHNRMFYQKRSHVMAY